MPTTTDILKEVTLQVLKRLGCAGTVEVQEVPVEQDPRGGFSVAITSDDSQRLIGQHGLNLQALQHMVRTLVTAQTAEPCHASLDVNGYRAEREAKIVRMAKEGAQKAVRSDSMVILRPMTSFERRLVHVALQGMPGISTESLGQDPNRRVVIKPSHQARHTSNFSSRGLTLDDIKV